MRIWVYPGSFDPVTLGHLDIITRAAALCDKLIVAVGYNPAKHGTFSVEERLMLLREACGSFKNVEVDSYQGLLVDYMKSAGAKIAVRSIRGEGDLAGETVMADMNRSMCPDTDTVFFMCEPSKRSLSSSVVREIASFHGDVSPYVPACVADAVKKKFPFPESEV